jgi:asparagine synthase (glutamine-hydrolysing)
MCGINGRINAQKTNYIEADICPMMKKMHHRGPDDSGTFFTNGLAFGFVRLSIIDLSPAGHQPFQSPDRRFTMVFNGEIFNYVELKEELLGLGHAFLTKTDTEVLLHSYMEWGKGMLDKLNGMWAIAIFDSQEQTIFCARDRYGIKPFYYTVFEDELIFSSEIPSILSVLPQKPQANKNIFLDYLLFNKTEQCEDTFFSGIKKLMHGHCLTISLTNPDFSKLKIEKWYNIHNRVNQADGFKTPAEYRKYFNEAVNLRLRSDVPIGVCFSGGLDSSAIVSVIMDEFHKEDLNTFSAVYDASFSGDESRFIHMYKDKPGQRHYVTPTAESLLEDLDRFIECHGEPLPSTSPYAQFKVMDLAHGKVVVTIDGQGADEQLAGYHYFFGFYFKDLLKRGKFFRLLKEMVTYTVLHKSFFAFKTFAFFLIPGKWRIKLKANELSYLDKEFVKEYGGASQISDNLYGSGSLQDALINHFEFKLEHLLKWEDRNSMYFSLEARVPFLDYRLVEKTLATQADMVIRDGWTKYILREAMKGTLPEAIRMRVDKNGFMTPQDEWFRTLQWQEKIKEIITSNSFANRGLFNVKEVGILYERHLMGEVQIAKEIWKWIHTELWFRKYIDLLNTNESPKTYKIKSVY